MVLFNLQIAYDQDIFIFYFFLKFNNLGKKLP